MAVLAVSDYSDFVLATGDGHVKGRMDFQNDASQNTYFWSKLAHGLGDKLFMNGGQSLRQSIMFKDNGSFAEYGRGQERTWSNVQVMEKMQAYMRFTDSHYVVEDQEILFNEGGGGDTPFDQFFKLREQKEAASRTAHWNGIENQLFAEPVASLMEGDGTTQVSPYSIFAHINEYTDGLYANGPGGTWTTRQGLTPSDANITPEYTNKIEQYNSENMGTYDTMLEGLDRLTDEINFEQPESFQQYFANPNMTRCFFLTSTVGRTAMKYLNRNGQDTWDRFGEAGIKDPTHNGIPIYRAKQMDTAAVWDDGSSDNTTEALAELTGPRVLAINGSHMHPVCHADRYWFMDEPIRHPNQPEARVFRTVMWWNLVCTSPRRQGLLEPGTDGMYYATS